MTEPHASTPSGPRDPEVGAEVDKVTSLIAGASQLIGEGKNVELSALETRVVALCETIGRMAMEDAQLLKEPLAAILGGLDGLEADLRSQHETANQGSEVGKHHQAANAYQSPAGQS
jgi:hypothetical protein